jgi:hypothetical protein
MQGGREVAMIVVVYTPGTTGKLQSHSDDCRLQGKELEGSRVALKIREMAGLHN